MIFRTFVAACAGLGFVACAGADTDIEAEVASPTIADVEAAPEAWRAVAPENLVIMQTTQGDVVLELLPEVAPLHVEQFRKYVSAGLYDNTPFHRVIDNFMAQGGDVEATYGPDAMLEPLPKEFTFRRDPAELVLDPIGPAPSAIGGLYKGFPIETQAQFMADPMWSQDSLVESWMPHCRGVLSSARLGEGPGVSRDMAENSANAQFFLISGEGRHLDKAYTAKGRVLKGLDVVQSIKKGPRDNGFPISNPDILQSAKLAADLPEEERPRAFVQRTDGEDWAVKLAAAKQLGSDVCALPDVPAVVG